MTGRPAAPANAVASLERHPNDGWVRADPWPMSGVTLRALEGVVAAVCPPATDGAPTTPALLADVVAQVRQMLPYMQPLTARGVVLILWLLDLSPLWRFQGLRRLHKLPHDAASSQLDVIAASKLFGKLVLAARATVLTAYFDQPSVHAAIGYAPVAFMRERIDARQRLLAEAAEPALLEPSEESLLAAREKALAAGHDAGHVGAEMTPADAGVAS